MPISSSTAFASGRTFVGLEPADQAITPRRQGTRVLVIDDNVDAAETLVMALELLGHTVRSAHTGLGGLAALEQFRPDCALVDIGLPDIDGYDVCRRIKTSEDTKHTKIIVLSGYLDEENYRKILENFSARKRLCSVDISALSGMECKTEELTTLERGSVEEISEKLKGVL